MKKIIVVAVALTLVVALLIAVPVLQIRSQRRTQIALQEHIRKPPVEHPVSPSSYSETSSAHTKRAAVNWDVPFTPQAPFGVWDPLHDEACEEASVLMVLRYFSGRQIVSQEDAESAIQHLVAANAALGFAVDDTAEEVITLLKSEDSSLRATLLKSPSIDDLKIALSQGSLIIIPAAGRQLGNPYFQTPGPLYHMLVLRGYTDDGYVITNDPGTKHGEQYAYRWDVLLHAIHDWNGGDVESGEKVVVVVNKVSKN